MYGTIPFGQLASNIRSLISSNRSGDTEDDDHGEFSVFGYQFFGLRLTVELRTENRKLKTVNLFDILNLFADLFQFGFALDGDLRDLGVIGLCTEGVQFPADL